MAKPGVRNREEYWWGRTARKAHRCGDVVCERIIMPGDRYVEMKLPPNSDNGNEHWWHLRACVPCAAKFNTELTQQVLARRAWTPDEVVPKGKRVTVKRACNGCGWLLGDVTDAEMERAIAGLPPVDVRAECPRCSTGASS